MRGQGRVFRPKVRGKHTALWWIDYSVRGKRYREPTGTAMKSEASRLLRERVGEREAGRVVTRPDRVTFSDLKTGLERHYQRKGNKSSVRASQALHHLERFFRESARALDITRHRVLEYIENRLRQGAARATVRYEVAILNAAFSVAVEEERLSVRPMFKLPTVRNARTGFFENAEFAALVVELPDTVRMIVRFARLTGWRKSEVLSLTWDQVDFDGKVIRIGASATKGGEARTFPFGEAPELQALVWARFEIRDGPFVFHRDGERIQGFRTAWKRACLRAGLEGKRVHDLRRTAARDFRRAGVSEGEIMKLCGWKTRAMFDRYNIIDEEDLAQAVGKRFNGKEQANNPTPVGSSPSLSSVPATGRRSSDG